MIENIIEMLFSSFLVVFTSTYIWKKLYNSNRSLLNKYIIFNCVFSCILITINYVFIDDFLKPFISTIILIIYCYSIFKGAIKKAIITTIYTQLLIILSEAIFAIIVILMFGANAETIIKTYYGNIISNLSIAFICIIISKINFIKTMYKKILSFVEKLNDKQIVFMSLILVILANIMTALVYYKISLINLLIVNTIIVVAYYIFIYVYLKTNNNYIKVYDKYNMTLNSLKEYEDILSRYRISNHENKNQLLTIRAMAKNKKVVSYIDEIIENKIKDNEKLMFDSLVIPEGGLRGLIYSKMLLMKENNIEFDLCVDKALKTTNLTDISDELMLNICNIVGVYLDNAIEAVKDLEEKYITIEIYLDDTLNIAITNNYEGTIDLDKIDDVGYSTKGGNHGYGLSLVREILNNYKEISNVRQISDDELTQEIKIKYKK